MKITPHILYAEDDQAWQKVMQDMLSDDFEVEVVNNGIEAWDYFQRRTFDMILTDLQMPEKDGFELIQLVRSKNTFIPIVIFSLMEKEYVIKGLGVGADDFISKTAHPQEFIARLQATLRRCHEYNRKLEPNNIFRISGNTTFNSPAHTLTVDNKTIHLTSLESRLLKFLVLQLNQCATKEYLTQGLWDEKSPEKNAYLDKYLVRLRKYLKKDPSVEIINVRGEGFCLCNQL